MDLHINYNLTLEEFGALCTIINLPHTENLTLEFLSTLSNDTPARVKTIIESLTNKGYLIKNKTTFSVNESKLSKSERRY